MKWTLHLNHFFLYVLLSCQYNDSHKTHNCIDQTNIQNTALIQISCKKCNNGNCHRSDHIRSDNAVNKTWSFDGSDQTFGVFKLSYALNRMHAAAMGDSLGIMMIVLGMMVIYGISFASLKLLTVLVVFWFASPVCSHLLAKLEVSTNEQIEDECEVPKE